MSRQFLIISLLLFLGTTQAQIPLPADVKHFPQTLGPNTIRSFYKECLPMYSSVHLENDSFGHPNLFILTLNTFQSTEGTHLPEHCMKVYPSQALLLSCNKEGVFPAWVMNFKDDTSATQENMLGLFQYHPDLGVYTLVRNEESRGRGTTLEILDSTFHTLALIPRCINNAHDFQLSKTTTGEWLVLSVQRPHPVYFYPEQINYAITSTAYDHLNQPRRLWSCGPTPETVDSNEWNHIYEHCDAFPMRKFNAGDMFHINSWQTFNWAKDSLLLAVAEKNDNKIRFWWIVDSSGTWVKRGMFRLGEYIEGLNPKDRFNDFVFPTEKAFHTTGAHNFRMLGKYQGSIIASCFDDEDCDALMPARGLILSLDVIGKTAYVLQQTSQGSYSTGRGSMDVMLEKNKRVTPQNILHANRCIAWGGYGKKFSEPNGYFPDGDTSKRRWQISVVNPNNQTIVGLTLSDEGLHDFDKVLNNTEYQAQAFYQLPVPHRPITYQLIGNSVTLVTNLVHPTWSTGDTTSTISLPDSVKERVWVRGKTDETMVGELWESIDLALLPEKKH